MAEVNVHEAKTHLSRLLQRAEAGEEIIIARGGEPVVKLVPIKRTKARVFGGDRGVIEVAEDFDAPLPPDVLAAFGHG